MTECITTHVGLDVHQHATAVAVAAQGRRAQFIGTIGPELKALCQVLEKQGSPASMQIVYEAGPCGYGLVRALRARGYPCDVIAPAKVARRPGDRVKTDRRDAFHLAEQSRAGALTAVWVLEEADEAIRDLSRAREDAVRARLKPANSCRRCCCVTGTGIAARRDGRRRTNAIWRSVRLRIRRRTLRMLSTGKR